MYSQEHLKKTEYGEKMVQLISQQYNQYKTTNKSMAISFLFKH